MQSSARHGADQLGLFDPATRAGMPVRVWLVLAGWGLAVSGDVPLERWERLVVEALGERFTNPETARKAAGEAAALFRYLRARGAAHFGEVTAGLVQEWFWAARMSKSGRLRRPAVSTARNRRWAAFAAFDEAARLGAPADAAALVGERIARPTGFVSARPLTAGEADLVRAFADAGLVGSRRAVLVALSFVGGSAQEIAAVRRCDIDLDAAAVRFGGVTARVGLLDDWGVDAVGMFLSGAGSVLGATDRLCVAEGTGPERGAHSVTVRLGRVLRDAGLARRPGVTARSIRLTTAREVLHTDGIEAAARFLGSPSLDSTAAALGYDWSAGGV